MASEDIAVHALQSNEWTGKHSFGGLNLHHVGQQPNPYEQAFSIIARTLAPFDDDNLIPAYGFGDGKRFNCLICRGSFSYLLCPNIHMCQLEVKCSMAINQQTNADLQSLTASSSCRTLRVQQEMRNPSRPSMALTQHWVLWLLNLAHQACAV